MDQTCKEGLQLGSSSPDGQGQTLLQSLLPLRELQVTPRGDPESGQISL